MRLEKENAGPKTNTQKKKSLVSITNFYYVRASDFFY